MSAFKSWIGILTYRRVQALYTMLGGVEKHCSQYPLIIAEDCGQSDLTADFLQHGRVPVRRPELMAVEYTVPDVSTVNVPNAQVFMGTRNLGVAGNSNRILKLFMDSGADHLCLCNDDLHVDGDFVEFYAKAHQDLGVGMFCFCDFVAASPAISGHPDSYKWTVYPWRGYKLKFLPRFTGIMISVTRALLEKVGYFDAVFTQFGEEHSDFTVRCRMAGGIRVDQQDMNCLDVEHALLRHQDVPTSVTGLARQTADREASIIMGQCARDYVYTHYHRPFRLKQPRLCGGYRGGGIPFKNLMDAGYQLVTDLDCAGVE